MIDREFLIDCAGRLLVVLTLGGCVALAAVFLRFVCWFFGWCA